MMGAQSLAAVQWACVHSSTQYAGDADADGSMQNGCGAISCSTRRGETLFLTVIITLYTI